MSTLRRSPTPTRGRVATVAALAIVSLLLGCTTATSSAGAIAVSDAWARTSMGMDRAAAAYLVLTNDADAADALIAATSPAATTVEIHETSTDAGGMTGMHPIDELPLPAGTTVTLEPGGYHLMLIDLTTDLEVGQTIEITLDFETAPDLTVTAEVRAG
jgi:copper(I)-binding protein